MKHSVRTVLLLLATLVAVGCSGDTDVETDTGTSVVDVGDTATGDIVEPDDGSLSDSGAIDTADEEDSSDSDVTDVTETDHAPDESTSEDSDVRDPGDCGDGILDWDEQCDDGEEQNGPSGNCSAECTRNPVQHFVVRATDLSDWEHLGDPNAVPTGDWAQAGSGCWANEPGEKFQIYLDFEESPADHITGFTIDDIQRIAYYSRIPSIGPFDFYALLYTQQDFEDDTGLFYGYRLWSLPTHARDLQIEADSWNLWSTDVGPNQLPFHDHAKQPAWEDFDRQPTLQELQATDAFDWSTLEGGTSTAIDYGSEVVRYFGIHTDGDWNEVGCLDSVTIELIDGRALTFDLEE